jgi:NAD+ synthase (glutamine-hydrolysing)
MTPMRFDNLYSHDFARLAVGLPLCRVADPVFNAEQTIALLAQAAADDVAVMAFPELGLSAYSCDDLFHQRPLLDGCEAALAAVLAATRPHPGRGTQDLPAQLR